MSITLAIQVHPEARPSPLEANERPSIPAPATSGSAGLDLSAWIPEPITLRPFQRARIPTGLRMAIPHGFEGQVRPRSGLAAKHGVTVLNAPGTIDSDYRGEVAVLLVNLGDQPFTIRRGDRIAQLVIAAVAHPLEVRISEGELPATARGEGGFGSSGVNGR